MQECVYWYIGIFLNIYSIIISNFQLIFGRPFAMLWYRCLSVFLSVTLAYCGHTVGWIKIKLDMQVGLGPGHVVFDGDPASPPPNGHSPQFSAHICCGQMAGWIKMLLGTEVGLGPRDIVLDRDPAPLPKKG